MHDPFQNYGNLGAQMGNQGGFPFQGFNAPTQGLPQQTGIQHPILAALAAQGGIQNPLLAGLAAQGGIQHPLLAYLAAQGGIQNPLLAYLATQGGIQHPLLAYLAAQGGIQHPLLAAIALREMTNPGTPGLFGSPMGQQQFGSPMGQQQFGSPVGQGFPLAPQSWIGQGGIGGGQGFGQGFGQQHPLLSQWIGRQFQPQGTSPWG
jgi:hypothetical protein